MNIVWAILITAAAAAVAVTALLLVRRRAPEGGYFKDGDRAAGVFGVLATGFSVLLGFIIFLAFDELRPVAQRRRAGGVDRRAAGRERAVLPAAGRGELTGQLVCYGRSVVNGEWDRMRAGTQGDAINPWGVRMFRTLQTVRPQTATSSPRTTSGSTRRRPGRRRVSIASTAPSA